MQTSGRHLFIDIFDGVGLDKTCRKLSVNIETSFNMRHCLMYIMEKELENEVLSREVELDETVAGQAENSLLGKKMQVSKWLPSGSSGACRSRRCA